MQRFNTLQITDTEFTKLLNENWSIKERWQYNEVNNEMVVWSRLRPVIHYDFLSSVLVYALLYSINNDA